MVMYELHMPQIMLGQLKYQNGQISKSEAEKEFRKGLLNLKLCLQMLKFEPEGTFEKQVYHGAKDSVQGLEQFVNNAFG